MNQPDLPLKNSRVGFSRARSRTQEVPPSRGFAQSGCVPSLSLFLAYDIGEAGSASNAIAIQVA